MWQNTTNPAHTPTCKATGLLPGAANVPLQISTLGTVTRNGSANGYVDMTSTSRTVKQGQCELCGDWFGDLREGACAPCRKRYGL